MYPKKTKPRFFIVKVPSKKPSLVNVIGGTGDQCFNC